MSIKKNDDLRQNLFLEVKKPEIKETKGTFIILTFKSSYWGPFSGLKSQDLIKISRIFPHGLFCRRSFNQPYEKEVLGLNENQPSSMASLFSVPKPAMPKFCI